MILKEIISASKAMPDNDSVFYLQILVDLGNGEEEIPYILRPDDTNGISQEIREAYADWIANGNTPAPFVAPPPAKPVPFDVNLERDRRIDTGFTFNGVLYQSRPEDRENIAGAFSLALAAVMNGAAPGDLRWHGGDSDFVWIAADDSRIPMDAQTVLSFGAAALDHKRALIFAGSALKALDPIPADFTADSYWP